MDNKDVLWVIRAEVLGAVSLQSLTLIVAFKTRLHQKDLEGAPIKGAGEVSTLTRSTGREIYLLLDSSAAEAVIGHATGMYDHYCRGCGRQQE